MKRILIYLGVFVIFVSNCYAHFLDDNPSRYRKIFYNVDMATYVEDSTILLSGMIRHIMLFKVMCMW